MDRRGGRLRKSRALIALALVMIALAVLLTRCPANRDGMPGQLAQAMEETTAAARSASTALGLLMDRRSTADFVSVSVSDARDKVVNAFKGIAELRAEDPVDVDRQRILTESMTSIIDQLNTASAAVRHIGSGPPIERLRDGLLASAQTLEAGYR